MKKIIRTNNLQKALEDYDALKGQPVIYVDTLPVSPNIRSAVYCKTITTDNTFARVLTPVELVQLYGQLDTEGHYKILLRFNVQYDNTRVRSIAFADGLAVMYEDDAYTDALPEQFTDDATYHFVVIVSTTEKAFYVGDAASQTLNPTVTFAEIERLDTKMGSAIETFDAPKVGGDSKYIVSVSESKGVIHAVEGNIDNTVTENSANLITSGAVFDSVSEEASLRNNAISNAINDLVSNITNDLNVVNLTATNATITDINVTNIVTNKLVADSGDVNSANMENLIANGVAINSGSANLNDVNIDNATITNLIANGVAINSGSANLNDVNIDNATITNLIANGVAGNDGQVLGKVNGNIEWVSTGIDTNDFSVNHLTVNESESVNGDNFTHKGFDVTSVTVISEDNYNNLGVSERLSAFYLTGPNGNMYIHGMMFTPQGFASNNIVDNVILENVPSSITTHTLTFTSGSVTNSNTSFRTLKTTPLGDWDVSLGVNATGSTVTTNADVFYLSNIDSLYSNCSKLTDTFIINNQLISNAPAGLNILRYSKNMSRTFANCSNLNRAISIPDSVTNVNGIFFGCYRFNQPVTISSSAADVSYMFQGCSNFNQPITIPNSVTDMAGMFDSCSKFNQPITIPNNAKRIFGVFQGCSSFNQPITIPNSITDASSLLLECHAFNAPVVLGNNVKRIHGMFLRSNFNQPITIPNSVTDMTEAFANSKFNQPITIPSSVINTGRYDSKLNTATGLFDNTPINCIVTLENGVTNMFYMFANCTAFRQSITIPSSITNMQNAFMNCGIATYSGAMVHISSTIDNGNTNNYIYNMLVNGGCGITFNPSRILNDA